MKLIYHSEKRDKVLRIIAGSLFIITGLTYFSLIFLSDSSIQKWIVKNGYIVKNGDLFFAISLVTIGIGLLVDKRLISTIGSYIGVLASLDKYYLLSLSKPTLWSFGLMESWFTQATYYRRYLSLLIVLLIVTAVVMTINNKVSFYLNCLAISLYIMLYKDLFSDEISGFFVLHIQDKLLLLFIISWFIALVVYTVFLFLTQINCSEPARTKVVTQKSNVSQAEEIIDKLYQLKSFVDNHVISVKEYVATKQRLLSPLFSSQQALASAQPESWGNSNLIQSNMQTNQVPQYYQPFMPMNQYPQAFQPNMPGYQYPGIIQPDTYTSQYSQPHQQSDSMSVNPYPNSIQKQTNHNDTDQKISSNNH